MSQDSVFVNPSANAVKCYCAFEAMHINNSNLLHEAADLFYYCACLCKTCSSALIGARFLDKRKTWQTSQSDIGGQLEICPYFYPCI